jgi:exopolyphosphatase/guanosine-5'-triphosphate,3'-diphosphate pyrophosphatase
MFITEHPVPTRQMQDMVAYCQKCLSEARLLFPGLSVDKMIAVAGTPTTLATLDQGLPFESDRVHGYVLSIGRVRSWVQKLAAMTIEERQVLAGMEPKRADVLVAGATILMLAAQTFGVREYQVSVRGLRYGLAIALEGRGDV